MIPVFEPQIGPAETVAVLAALQRGEISGTFGTALEQFETEFAEYCGVRHAVAVNSGTAALQALVAAAGIGAGDEVLVSASTNIATALAAWHNGAVPIPVDSEAETWNLDLELLPSLITPRTRAIIAVHLYGHPVDMDRLGEIARQHDLLLIEDAAQAHGATCRGRKTGGLGDAACFSFYANKVITTGEGGMVTTDDDGLAERVRLLRNLAFTKPRFRHEQAGFNFRMTGLQAALGVAQLGQIDEIIGRKREIARLYNKHLAATPGLKLPAEQPWAENVYWMYAVVVDTGFGVSRDQLAKRLRADGIDTRTFFCPMNLQPCFSTARTSQIACPVAERLWNSGLYLPSSLNLTEDTISHICSRVRAAQSPNWKQAA